MPTRNIYLFLFFFKIIFLISFLFRAGEGFVQVDETAPLWLFWPLAAVFLSLYLPFNCLIRVNELSEMKIKERLDDGPRYVSLHQLSVQQQQHTYRLFFHVYTQVTKQTEASHAQLFFSLDRPILKIGVSLRFGDFFVFLLFFIFPSQNIGKLPCVGCCTGKEREREMECTTTTITITTTTTMRPE